ncbi:unnamed protein product, partial [Heterosigma akashiwo]
FGQTILFCICVAAVLVGIQTYESLESNRWVTLIDNIILAVFTLEVLVKLAAEGERPWRYFTGPERAWNTFDFIILVFCMPFMDLGSGGSVSFLRLMRLMRVTKIFKSIPELQIIVMGLALGVRSIGYIMMLLGLVFYLFAVMAVFMFRDNDPANFGNLAITMLSLFRCATLEDWTDIMYINMLGCDVYDAGLYSPANSTVIFSTGWGNFGCFTCVHPRGLWVVSALFFICFTVISAFVMLSLFIGAITLSMSEVLDEQQRERKRQKIQEVVSPDWLWETLDRALTDKKIDETDFQSGGGGEEEEGAGGGGGDSAAGTAGPADIDPLAKAKQRAELVKQRSRATLTSLTQRGGARWRRAWQGYLRASLTCRRLTHSPKFENFMLATIGLAGVSVGLSTNRRLSGAGWLAATDAAILAVFTVELVLKVLAEGRLPHRFFLDPWNRFDFVIVLGSYLPLLLGGGGVGSVLALLRLMRVLRVLKVVKSSQKLKIVVEAVLKGFQSITYISVMMVILFFMFAVVGMILFRENDPWHFGQLQDAMLTLFRCATLEDWTDVMYINMWGCARYGYGHIGYGDTADKLCDPAKSNGLGWLAALYFVVFAVIGSLILVTLFLGVVTTSMEQAAMRERMEADLKEEIKAASDKYRITAFGIRLLYNAYKLLDEDEGGYLEYEELRPMLSAVSPDFTEKVFRAIFAKVDVDRSGEIDFAEFIQLCTLIKQ